MAATAMRFPIPKAAQAAETSPAPRADAPGRWQALRDLLGGALLILLTIALWTAAWAAVAGPLSPVEQGGAAAAMASGK